MSFRTRAERGIKVKIRLIQWSRWLGKTRNAMSGDSSSDDSDPFTSIKQWFCEQFRGNSADTNSSQNVPKIVVTRGSAHGRPRPLRNTWDNKEDPPKRGPSFITEGVRQALSIELPSIDRLMSKSLPCSPQRRESPEHAIQSAPSENTSNIFRFSRKINKRKRTDFDDTCLPEVAPMYPVCGTCGQQIKFRNGYVQPEYSRDEKETYCNGLSSPSLSHRTLDISASSSSRGTDVSETEQKRFITETSARMVKAASSSEQQNQQHYQRQFQQKDSARQKRVRKRKSSRDKSSSVSLNRSWSINLDKFRIIKNNPFTFNSEDTVARMSQSNNDVCRLNVRDKADSFDDLLDYSPKLTRTTMFVNGTPLDDFKQTFQSDAIKVPSIYGKIKVMFQLFNERNIFLVTVLDGKNTAPFQSGNLGIYVKISLMPGKVQKKTSRNRHNTRDPVFYEPFAFRMGLDELLDRQLKVKLYNKPGIFSLSEPVGECVIPLYHYDLTAVTVIWQNLRKSKGQKDDLDHFDFSIMERNSSARPGAWSNLLCGSRRRRRYEQNGKK